MSSYVSYVQLLLSYVLILSYVDAYLMFDGVGQGCPSAADLFVIGTNPLPVAPGRIIDTPIGEAESAFADDAAVVLSALGRMNIVHAIFAEYKLASALAVIFLKDGLRADRLWLPLSGRRRNPKRSQWYALGRCYRRYQCGPYWNPSRPSWWH